MSKSVKIAFNFLLDLIGKIGLYFNFSPKCFNRSKVWLKFHSNALTCNGKCYLESCMKCQSISIANRHYNTQKKYACHMKVILDTKSEKGQLY